MDNQNKFLSLRQQYPQFIYEGYRYKIVDNQIDIQFDYTIGDAIRFSPKMRLETGKYGVAANAADLDGIVFHIGLIELISYWKCTCSPKVLVRGHHLSENQQLWWKKLYWKGLGEFFYQNGIKTDIQEFLQFDFDNEKPIEEFHYQKVINTKGVIVPIGGGKDSVVTLEHLRKKQNIVPFIINPRGGRDSLWRSHCSKRLFWRAPDV